MARIRKGRFTMGSRSDDRDRGFEGAARQVQTDSYCIDRFEYPNRRGAQPLPGVNLHTARRLCAARGRRLCSDQEWVRACGGGGRKYPYGNSFDPGACITEDGKEAARPVAPSGKAQQCKSTYGVYDLSGNLAEWTESGRVRGGSGKSPDYGSHCNYASRKNPGSADGYTGFRCCKDAD